MAVTLFLIRHATAGVRNHQNPHDDQRELDENGWNQAQAIAATYGAENIEALFSSPALRCQQTIAPLANQLGLEVTIAPELFEGASTSTSIEFVRSFTRRNVVMSSHGDVIPDVLRNLEVGGCRLEGRGCSKGSVWVFDNSTERIESGAYREFILS